MQRGDNDGAIALFERIKKIDPVSEFASLSNGRQFAEDMQTLESLEQSASNQFSRTRRTGAFFLTGQCSGKAQEF